MSGVTVRQPETRRGSYAKTAETRKSILDAALDVFAESGYRGGSLREIALRVGMSEAGLLHHFPSKSSLLSAVLKRRDDVTGETNDLASDLGVATLTRVIEIARRNMLIPGIVQLYCTVSAEATSSRHPSHSYFVARYATNRKLLTDAFTAMRERGELHDGVDPDRAARGTLAFMDGLQVQWLLDKTSVDMAADLEAHLNLLTTARLQPRRTPDD